MTDDPTDQPSGIPTQPEPLHLARAARVLDAVLAGDLDVETRLAVGAALAVLRDVHPPYPPLPPPTRAIPAGEGIAAARAELDATITGGVGVPNIVRAGLAARELRLIGRRR
jgi:hypothetical protein